MINKKIDKTNKKIKRHTICHTLENWLRFITNQIKDDYELWIVDKETKDAGLKQINISRTMIDEFKNREVPKITTNHKIWNNRGILKRPRDILYINNHCDHPQLWTEDNVGAFAVNGFTPQSQDKTPITIVPDDWMSYFKFRIEIYAMKTIRYPQIILGTPEEALYYHELIDKMPDHLRAIIVQTWEPILQWVPLYKLFFTFAHRVQLNTLSGYFGKLDEARKFWNDTYPQIQFRSIAHMMNQNFTNPQYETEWVKVGKAMIEQHMIYGQTSHTVVGNIQKALAHMFRALDWIAPNEWKDLKSAAQRLFPQIENPCSPLPLNLWNELMSFSRQYWFQAWGATKKSLEMATCLSLQLNCLFLVAFRPQEFINLQDYTEVKLFLEKRTNFFTHNKPKKGAYIFLTRAKNRSYNAPPQLVCLHETNQKKFSIVYHVEELRKYKIKFNIDCKELFFNPKTRKAWTYTNLNSIWEITINQARKRIENFPKSTKHTLYTGRKTFIASGIELKIPRHVVQAVTRHCSIATIEKWYERLYRHQRGTHWSEFVNNYC